MHDKPVLTAYKVSRQQAQDARKSRIFARRDSKLINFATNFGRGVDHPTNVMSSKQPPEIIISEQQIATNSPLLPPSSPGPRQASFNIAGNDATSHKFNGRSKSTPNTLDVSSPMSRSLSVRTQIGSFFEVSDNRLAIKIFGNRRALEREKARQQKTSRFIIHPCSKFRFYWDLIMLGLLVSNMVLLPLAIAFYSEDFMQPHWLTFNCLSDIFFIIDILVNFRTGVISNEPGSEVILDPRKICFTYLKSWFIIDFMSSVPVDYIFMFIIFMDGQPMHHNASLLHAGRAFRIMRLAKFMGLLRLLRLSRLVRYINEWQEFLNVATMVLRITNLVGFTVILAHWNGCMQFMIPMMQGFPSQSWVARGGLINATVYDQYTMSIFRALSHMLSIGYGQQIPEIASEAWMTIISMLVGATVHAIFLGHMTNLIHSYDSSRRMYTEKQKQLQEYMFARKLPRSLRDRITDYYEHRYQGKMFDETSIMREISDALREDVIGYNCRILIQRVPFFENAEASFLSDVLTKLKPEMFQPGDYIIKEGTIGKRMYFIQDGTVDIVKHNEILTSLTEGSYFGEICLLAPTKRCASVRAVTYCQLFSLNKANFDEILEHYPMMKRTMKGIAAQRLYKIGENPRIVSHGEELAQDLSVAHEILKEPTGINAVTRPSPSSEHLARAGGGLTASVSNNHLFQTPSLMTTPMSFSFSNNLGDALSPMTVFSEPSSALGRQTISSTVTEPPSTTYRPFVSEVPRPYIRKNQDSEKDDDQEQS